MCKDRTRLQQALRIMYQLNCKRYCRFLESSQTAITRPKSNSKGNWPNTKLWLLCIIHVYKNFIVSVGLFVAVKGRLLSSEQLTTETVVALTANLCRTKAVHDVGPTEHCMALSLQLLMHVYSNRLTALCTSGFNPPVWNYWLKNSLWKWT